MVTLDIINEKAINLLEDMEQLQLIKLHKEAAAGKIINWADKFKGQMTKQPLSEVDDQPN